MHIAFGIDELNLNMLSASRFRLSFGVGCALFVDISKKEKEPQQNEKARNEMENQFSDLATDDEDDENDVTIITNNVTAGHNQTVALHTNAQNPGAGGDSTVTDMTPLINTNTTTQNVQITASGVNNTVIPMDTEAFNQTGAKT